MLEKKTGGRLNSHDTGGLPNKVTRSVNVKHVTAFAEECLYPRILFN